MKCDVCGKRGTNKNIHTAMWINNDLLSAHDGECEAILWRRREEAYRSKLATQVAIELEHAMNSD